MIRLKHIFSITILFFCISCDQSLDEEVFDEVSSANFFQSDQDAITAANSLYVKLRGAGTRTTADGQAWGLFAQGESIFRLNQDVTDETWTTWAKLFPSGSSGVLESFNFTPFNTGGGVYYMYRDLYEGISIANNIIANLEDNDAVSSAVKDQVLGQALFARGLFYYHLNSLYGEVPLILEPVANPFNTPFQASEDELVASISSDLERAGQLLPIAYPSSEYGRFTKGAAYALLSRFYLNKKMWQESAEAANEILDDYSLSADYASIFSPDNNGNPEILFSILSIAQAGLGNAYLAATAEPNQVSASWGGDRVHQEFYESFDPTDIRRQLLVKTYTSIFDDSEVTLSDEDGAVILKYAEDENHVGPWASNDIVVLRYASVILDLAEALNEINGPNQESIDQINRLRGRAFPNDPTKLISLSDFSSKEQLRDHILDERGWELYYEGYRRDDLKRHGKFIERAQARGRDAKAHQSLYPIPQTYLDINPNLVQNAGY